MWTSIHFSRLIIIPPYSYHSSADLTNAAATPLRKMKQFIPHHVKYQQDINAGGTGRVADTLDYHLFINRFLSSDMHLLSCDPCLCMNNMAIQYTPIVLF
jgi:hypothetical protein